MLYLHTFGGWGLSRDGVRLDDFAAQQKALALLVLLAAEPGGMSRANVLAHLWPESDEERARMALRQLVRTLRSGLQSPDLVEGTAVLKLGIGVATSDVREFREALAHGDDTGAVAVYAGSFLDGFHLRGAREFESWVDRQRAALFTQWTQSLNRLATAATTRGDFHTAVEYWRRLAAADPLASVPALGLLRALDAADDRPSALRHARVHAALVQLEFGTDPDASIVTFVQELRAGRTGLAQAKEPELPSSEASERQPPATVKLSTLASTTTSEPVAPRALPVPQRARSARTYAVIGGALAIAILFVAAARDIEAPWVKRGPDDPQRSATASDRHRTDSVTHELYRRGRHAFHNRIDDDGIRQAARYFDSAIARDPTYAPAHAGLSDAYTRLAVFGYADPPTMLRLAKDAALRAVALDSNLAEGRVALAHALLVGDYAWDAAEHEFRRALALDPQYAFGRAPFAILLSARGRYTEALAQLDTASATEPLAPWIANVRGRVLVAAGRPREAVRVLEQALTLYPVVDMAHQQLGHAFLALGLRERAIASLQRAAAMNGARDSAHLAYGYAASGDRTSALRIVQKITIAARPTLGPSGTDALAFHLALAYAGLGDHDAAFRWLERGRSGRAPFMIVTAFEPGFQPLHGDPRWTPLLLGLGIPPSDPRL